MSLLKELWEKRKAVAGRIEEMRVKVNDDAQEWTDEDEANWTAANDEYNALTKQITMEERGAEVAKEQDERMETADRPLPPGREDYDGRETAEAEDKDPAYQKKNLVQAATEEERCLAMQAWMLYQAENELTERHVEAAKKAGVNVRSKTLDIALRRDYRVARREFRAMSTSLTAGGDTIPEGFVNNFEVALLAFGGIRRVANILRTATGNTLPWPTTNDTANKGALLAENVATGAQDVATSYIELGAYKYTSKLIRVSAELLQDSAFDLATFLGERCGERIGRITADHYTTGTGTAQPNGIVTAATLGVTAASATAITYGEIIDLEHSVDPAYRVGAGFAMHDSVMKAIRKLVDSNSRYLWQDSIALGVPQTLSGYPVNINQSMASALSAAAKTILFGLFSKFIIRDVAGIRFRRLVERYAEFDQEGFVAFFRTDSELLDAGTNPVKCLQQAAGGGSGSGS